MIFDGRDKFLKAISNNCPDTKVIYDNNNIVVINVNSFKDCHNIFYHNTINWCIAESELHWVNYVGNESCKQFFIIDFNKLHSSQRDDYNLSLIGFTLKNGDLYAAHGRDDRNLLNAKIKDRTGFYPFENVLKSKGLYDFVIKRKMKDIKEVEKNALVTIGTIIALIVALMTYLALTN